MPVSGDLALDELRDGQVVHRLAGDVDLEADVVLGEQVDRLAGDPLVDLLDQAEALRGVDEGGGHDDLAVVADHAQQQLVLGDRVGRELQDRLAVEDEAVLVERAADLVGPVEADLHAADVLAAVGGGDVVAVAAGLLGRVHREVGARPSGPRRAGSSSPKQTMPIEVVIEIALALERQAPLADRLEHALGDALRGVAVGVAQQDGELVAAEAGDDVGLADAVMQRAADRADDLVAGLVAAGVVDVLEAVEVEQEDRALAAVAGGVGDELGELLVEAAAVEELGQRVVVGQVLQLVLEALALRDVADDRRERRRRRRSAAARP